MGGLDISKADVSELNLAGMFSNPPIGGGSNSGGGDGSAGFKVGGLGGGSGGGGSLFGNPPATMETAGVLSGGQNTMPDNSGNFLAQGGFNNNFGQSNPSIPFGQSSPNSSGSIFGPSSSDNSMNNNPNVSGLYPQINAQSNSNMFAQPNQSQSQLSMFGNQTGQQISFGQANQSQSQPSIFGNQTGQRDIFAQSQQQQPTVTTNTLGGEYYFFFLQFFLWIEIYSNCFS